MKHAIELKTKSGNTAQTVFDLSHTGPFGAIECSVESEWARKPDRADEEENIDRTKQELHALTRSLNSDIQWALPSLSEEKIFIFNFTPVGSVEVCEMSFGGEIKKLFNLGKSQLVRH